MPKASTILAVDLGGTKICVALVDHKAAILARRTEPIDQTSRLKPIHQIVRLAKEVAIQAGTDRYIRAAGVVVPGLVRPNGAVWAPNVDGWDRIPLARILQQRLGIPVLVDSDRAGAVLGEVFAPEGAARGRSDVISLIIGTGIGAGILSGGRLMRGAHELSGCAGWMAMSTGGNGSRRSACLETFASGSGVVRLAKAAIEAGAGGAMASIGKRKITSQDVAQLARNGDAASRKVWLEVAQLLGMAVANLVSLFDPELVVVGGGLVAAADCYWSELKRTALRRAQPLAAKRVKIVLSKLGNDANLLGASYLAQQRLLNTPLNNHNPRIANEDTCKECQRAFL